MTEEQMNVRHEAAQNTNKETGKIAKQECVTEPDHAAAAGTATDAQLRQAKIERRRRTIRYLSIFSIVLTIIIGIWVANTNYFTQDGQFQADIERAGIYAPILFVLFQIVQVIYPVIPGGVVSVVGYGVFNPLWGTVYNVIGIFIGSVINFLLARRFGRFFVEAFVSEEQFNKYIGWVDKGKRFYWFLFVAFFLPAAPDDFLCMVAGLTKMKLREFNIIWWLTKPISTYVFTRFTYEGVTFIFSDVIPWIMQMFQ